jgi:hypothetical protein
MHNNIKIMFFMSSSHRTSALYKFDIKKDDKISVTNNYPRGGMGNTKLPPLIKYFLHIEDTRRETKNKKYPLIEAIVIAFLAVMSRADGWESMERYGVMRKKWPSHGERAAAADP